MLRKFWTLPSSVLKCSRMFHNVLTCSRTFCYSLAGLNGWRPNVYVSLLLEIYQSLIKNKWRNEMLLKYDIIYKVMHHDQRQIRFRIKIIDLLNLNLSIN